MQILLSLVLVFFARQAFCEPGISASEIKIGVSTALTGSASDRASALLAGSKLYFDKINKEGGVLGRKINLVVLDDAYQPSRAVENVRRLFTEDQVFAIYSVYGTPTATAVLPFLKSHDLPLVAPSSGGEFLRNPVNENVFNIRVSYYDESVAIVSYIVNKLGIKEVAVLYQDDAFGSDGRSGVNASLRSFNLKPLVQASYVHGTSDVTAAFGAIQKSGAKAVIMWSLKPAGLEFMRLAQKAKFHSLVFANAAFFTKDLVKEIESLSSNFYMTSGVPLVSESNLPLVNQFRKDAEAAALSTSSEYFEGYLNAVVFTEALRRSGKDLTRESLRKSFDE